MAVLTSGFPTRGLPDHCTPTTDALADFSAFFGVCIPTPQAAISTALGCLSILSWLLAQSPQLIKNYKIKSTAGLSIYFLGEWLLGDIANLVGGILTYQAGWQITIASYYCFVDTCLMTQYLWYRNLRYSYEDGSVHSRPSTSDTLDDDDDMINSLSPINSNFMTEQEGSTKQMDNSSSKSTHASSGNTPQFIPVNYEQKVATSPSSYGTTKEGRTWNISPSPRTLLHAATLSTLVSRAVASPIPATAETSYLHVLLAQEETTAEIIGSVISWCSTILYIGSRMPQIYRNWHRQSTTGLSPFMFLAAFCGNLFYTSSLAVSPFAWNDFGPFGGHGWAGPGGSDRNAWIISTAPFFFGAFGCLGLDLTIGIQFMLYQEPEEKLVKVRYRNGETRWEKVSGWMRGWIPSLSREKVVNLVESQRLLGQSREMDGTRSYTRL